MRKFSSPREKQLGGIKGQGMLKVTSWVVFVGEVFVFTDSDHSDNCDLWSLNLINWGLECS